MPLFGGNRRPPALRAAGSGGRKPPRRSGWYEGSGDFNRDDNTPQFSTVWGHCLICGKEGPAQKTMYQDGTVYYTPVRCKHRDHFAEHTPTSGEGQRKKEADRPIQGWNERKGRDEPGSYTQGRDPTKGLVRNYQENRYCTRCKQDRMCHIVEQVDEGVKHVMCGICGKKWTEH